MWTTVSVLCNFLLLESRRFRGLVQLQVPRILYLLGCDSILKNLPRTALFQRLLCCNSIWLAFRYSSRKRLLQNPIRSLLPKLLRSYSLLRIHCASNFRNSATRIMPGFTNRQRALEVLGQRDNRGILIFGSVRSIDINFKTS